MWLNPFAQKHTPPHRLKPRAPPRAHPSRWFPRATHTSAFSTEIFLLHLPACWRQKEKCSGARGEVVPPFPILNDDFTLLPHPRATCGNRHAAQISCEVVNMQRALVWAKQFQETQQSCSRKYKNKDHTQMIWSEISVQSLGAREAARHQSRACGSEKLGKERHVKASVQVQAMTSSAPLNNNQHV